MVGDLLWKRIKDGTYQAVPTIRYLKKWRKHRRALESVGYDIVAIRRDPIDNRITFDPKVASRDEMQLVIAIVFPTRKRRTA